MLADDYASFATDYHWFFDDVALRLGSDVPGVRAALSRLPAGSRVLDAACGIGVDAAWLDRQGHSVAAADASRPMIDVARERLEGSGQAIDLVNCTWERLGDHFEPAGFDVVLCIGSAIAHSPDAEAMVVALEALGSMLRPGGALVIDTHDWELVMAGGDAATVDPVVIDRDGLRCVRSFRWDLPDRPREPAVFEPSVILVDGERATMRSYPIRLWPFTRRDLGDRLAAAGFDRIGLDSMPGDDRYTAVAHAPA